MNIRSYFCEEIYLIKIVDLIISWLHYFNIIRMQLRMHYPSWLKKSMGNVNDLSKDMYQQELLKWLYNQVKKNLLILNDLKMLYIDFDQLF